MTSRAEHAASVRAGERFRFGDNWRDFIRHMSPQRIDDATESFVRMCGLQRLDGMSFLDVGSGSGLSSLVALRLGARVHSFDYDPVSVSTTRALREHFAPHSAWTVEEGSVLDADYCQRLGKFDFVYSWGVLHHTGHMWTAFENVVHCVAPMGYFQVAIYNDLAATSDRWRKIKQAYNRMPAALRMPFALGVLAKTEARTIVKRTLGFRLREYVRTWTHQTKKRGMSRWHDWIDWVGGYPYEVAKPEEIIEFCQSRGMELIKLRTVAGSHGCNEFVFRRVR